MHSVSYTWHALLSADLAFTPIGPSSTIIRLPSYLHSWWHSSTSRISSWHSLLPSGISTVHLCCCLCWATRLHLYKARVQSGIQGWRGRLCLNLAFRRSGQLPIPEVLYSIRALLASIHVIDFCVTSEFVTDPSLRFGRSPS